MKIRVRDVSEILQQTWYPLSRVDDKVEVSVRDVVRLFMQSTMNVYRKYVGAKYPRFVGYGRGYVGSHLESV